MTGQVAVHRLGEGQPGGLRVALAHGLEDAWSSWRAVAAKLDTAWRISAFDLPWRAGSDYRWRHRLGAASWLAAALDQLGEPIDLLVAHSFGANAALELAAADDDHVGPGLVLICPLYRPAGAPVTWRMLDVARRNFEDHIRAGVRARLGGRADQVDAELFETMLDKALERVGPMGLLTAFDCFVSSCELALEKIDRRVMILAAGVDTTLSASAASMLAARLPYAQLQIDAEFDHFCHICQPDDVAARIRAFVQGGLS